MKEFFRSFLAALLALIVFIVLLLFFIGGWVGGLSKKFEADKETTKPNSVLKINVNYSVSEQTQIGLPSGLSWLSFNADESLGLNDILANIKHAEKDDNIKGIYLELGINQNSYATLQEIRDALEDFKKNSGKFIYAYGEIISQSSYFLGSVADKVYLNPSGAIDFKGYSAEIQFYKNALDKLGVKVQVFYDGKFKSATEPYRYDKMSDENRLQLREFLNGLFDYNLSEIASTRHKSIEDYKLIADSLMAWYPSEAVKVGLVDALKYEDEVMTDMRSPLGIGTDDAIDLVSMKTYKNSFAKDSGIKKNDDKQKIAIVYADGTIIDGEGESGYIGSKTFKTIFEDISRDQKIKAVVLRINSPGGSAVASDVIWRSIEVLKKTKPVIVSMGDYAASGGYMMSCNATKIFAEPNTLTGSIGVFLVVPDISDLMTNKLGITFDTVKTSAYSDFPSINRPFSAKEKQVLQAGVDSTYLNFKTMVAQGRNMTVDQVQEIAQGRIWIGLKAKELGLVDEIGGIDDAIAEAVKQAGISDYEIAEYPQQKTSVFEDIISSMTEASVSKIVENNVGILYPEFKTLNELINRPVMQARLPYMLHIN